MSEKNYILPTYRLQQNRIKIANNHFEFSKNTLDKNNFVKSGFLKKQK